MDFDSIWWTAGTMDGDGSVNGNSQGGVSTSVGKALKGFSSLERLKELHSGRINRNAEAKDNTQEAHSWVMAGPVFCEMIAPYVQLKKPQFELAATYPTTDTKGHPLYAVQGDTRLFFSSLKDLREHFEISKNKASAWFHKDVCPPLLKSKGWILESLDVAAIRAERKHIRSELVRLKLVEHAAITIDLPHSYFAGMFDCEVTCKYFCHIRLVPNLNSPTSFCRAQFRLQVIIRFAWDCLRSIVPFAMLCRKNTEEQLQSVNTAFFGASASSVGVLNYMRCKSEVPIGMIQFGQLIEFWDEKDEWATKYREQCLLPDGWTRHL